MSDYTPITYEVRERYMDGRIWDGPDYDDDDEPLSEFDRWLAAHDRDVAAKACDRLRAAIREALDFQAVLPAIATKPREILTKALEATS